MTTSFFNSSLNTAMMVGLRTYEASQRASARSMERLTTGKRINRTSDDPAGAAAAENLARDAVDLSNRIKGAERSQALFGTADGALSVVGDLLQGLNELVVRAANRSGTTEDERKAMQDEAESIVQGIAHVLGTTVYDGTRVLQDGFTASLPDGSFTWSGITTRSLGSQSWAGVPRAPSSPEPVAPEDPGAPPDVGVLEGKESAGDGPKTVGLEDIRGVLNLVHGDSEAAQRVVKAALETVNGTRGMFGSYMKFDLGARLNVTRKQLEGVSSEYSRIMDTDYAAEISAFVRAQIIQQVSIASLRTIFEAQRDSTLGLLKQ